MSQLNKVRQTQIVRLNTELSLAGTELAETDCNPRYPLNKYNDGRLTKRGIEICYRFFDMGNSRLAVAHLTGLSLAAARKRQKTWKALGGCDRVKADISKCPHRKFYTRNDD